MELYCKICDVDVILNICIYINMFKIIYIYISLQGDQVKIVYFSKKGLIV